MMAVIIGPLTRLRSPKTSSESSRTSARQTAARAVSCRNPARVSLSETAMALPPSDPSPARAGWGSLRQLTGYQWFVFVVACLAWDLDCMDQQLFNVARRPAMMDLVPQVRPDDPRLPDLAAKLGKEPTHPDVLKAQFNADVADGAALATSIFLIGWAVGGIGFGIMGDRLGRVRTLMLTIMLYSVFTGLSAASTSVYDFCAYRFLTGLGVGAVFAVAVSLVAESVPPAARPYMLGLLQMSSAFGNITAASVSIALGYLQIDHQLGGYKPWKIMFLIGIVPALLIVLIQSRLREPDAWTQARADHRAGLGKQLGSFRELFGDPRWRSRAIFGVLLAFAGVVGLWGIGFFARTCRRMYSTRSSRPRRAGRAYPGRTRPPSWAGARPSGPGGSPCS
jgi:hypothetical protein